MAETGMSFQEIKIKDSNPVDKWKEINIDTGDHSDGIPECGFADVAGGYTYRDSGRLGSPARNRFICWRTSGDVLELVETSLDLNLSGCCVRFRFQDAPIVGRIGIHESHGSVLVLVTTACSVHRLIFPHPNRLQKYDHGYLQGSEITVPSIFTDASIVRVQDPGNAHIFSESTQMVNQLQTAATWLTNEGEALFALATKSGSILLFKLPPYGIQGIVTQHELKQSSVMQRLWTGFVPSVMRGGSDTAETALSLLLHPLGSDTYIFSVTRDCKLKMWACKTHDCVMATNLLEYLPDTGSSATQPHPGCTHLVRKSESSSRQELFLGVHLSFPQQSQFCIVQPIFAESRYKLQLIAVVFAPQDVLLDFCVTAAHLWSLWGSPEGSTDIKCAAYDTKRPSLQQWAHLGELPTEAAQLEVGSHLDTREAYCTAIFSPGRFSTATILRALNIFKRSLDATVVPDSSIPIQVLKAEVMSVVEQELQSSASGLTIGEEEFEQLQVQLWSRFYSCVQQYHERGMKSLGLFADGNTGLVALVRKTAVSCIRPSDPAEQLYLTPTNLYDTNSYIQTTSALLQDEDLLEDVQCLAHCLQLMSSLLTDEMETYFELDIFHAQNPQTVADSIITTLLTDTVGEERAECLQLLQQRLSGMEEWSSAVEWLLSLLDLSQDDPQQDHQTMEEGLDASRQLGLSHLLSSVEGIAAVCESTRQVSLCRFRMSRDLLLTLTLMGRMCEQTNVYLSLSVQLKSQLLMRASLFVRSYFLLKWCAETKVTTPSAQMIETSQQMLEALDLYDGVNRLPQLKPADQNITLLECFVKGAGGQRVREMLVQESFLDDDPCDIWTKALMPVINAVTHLLWPYNDVCVFVDTLLLHSQYSALQEYTRLVRDWCDSARASYRLIQALSYLASNETEKAEECFREALPGVGVEPLLSRLLPGGLPSPRHAEVEYLLRAIGVFEALQLPSHVVTLAHHAISIAADDDPNVTTLWSKVFKQQLELGHNQEAYTAMLSNPDSSRRKDCLRQFLVVLCERSQLHTLVSLPYRDRHVVLEEEVVSILESRARAIDLTQHNYYDLLYAFHIFRSNYRRAGSVMYEYGMRLGREVSGLRGLQHQAKCYLAALNALRLVSPDYAWILKPLPAAGDDDNGEEEPRASPKHSVDGHTLHPHKRPAVEVLELAAIQREYVLVSARLTLLRDHPDLSHAVGPTPDPHSIVGLLLSAGLYDTAIRVCTTFDLPYTQVFEGLANRCVSLAQNCQNHMVGDNEYTAAAWKWLHTNSLPPANAAKDASAAEPAWRLLQDYLDRYDDATATYHTCVTARLLSQGFAPPHWLIQSYQRHDPAGLLRLYMNYDQLEEAANLSLQYVDAVMGRGKEYFGLKTYLHVGAPSVWLPYTSLDQLLAALAAVRTDPHYIKLHQKLSGKMEQYFEAVERISVDTIQAAEKRAVTARRGNVSMFAMTT